MSSPQILNCIIFTELQEDLVFSTKDGIKPVVMMETFLGSVLTRIDFCSLNTFLKVYSSE